MEYLCSCSFLEIYNEQVYDLLDTSSIGLHLRENIKRGVYVDGLSEQTVSSAKEAYDVSVLCLTFRRICKFDTVHESTLVCMYMPVLSVCKILLPCTYVCVCMPTMYTYQHTYVCMYLAMTIQTCVCVFVCAVFICVDGCDCVY